MVFEVALIALAGNTVAAVVQAFGSLPETAVMYIIGAGLVKAEAEAAENRLAVGSEPQ
jgi:hypothetical protein